MNCKKEIITKGSESSETMVHITEELGIVKTGRIYRLIKYGWREGPWKKAALLFPAGVARTMKFLLTDKRKLGQIKGKLFLEGKYSNLDILTRVAIKTLQ